MIPAQASSGHSSASTPGIAWNVEIGERFRTAVGHDRVEHERFDVLGIALGVLERDLGAVGGAVQHELFIAAREA